MNHPLINDTPIRLTAWRKLRTDLPPSLIAWRERNCKPWGVWLERMFDAYISDICMSQEEKDKANWTRDHRHPTVVIGPHTQATSEAARAEEIALGWWDKGFPFPIAYIIQLMDMDMALSPVWDWVIEQREGKGK